MNSNLDTIDRLRQMHAPTAPVGDEIVQQDVSRGQAAVQRTRRRQAWAAGGIGGLALAAVIAGSVLANTLPTSDIQALPTSDPISGTTQPVMELVSYTGAQPDGFHLGKIPAGFAIESSDEDTLILSPLGEGAASSTEGPAGYTGKIVISKNGTFDYSKDLREVTINGQPARIALTDDVEPATEVQFVTGDHTVNIQIWSSLHLTDEQIVDFAQSITVTGDPTISGG
jgi:hypothetical protein